MGRTTVVAMGLAAAIVGALPVTASGDGGAGASLAGSAAANGRVVPSEAEGAEGDGSGRRGHHRGQVGLSLSLATGYRFIKPWDSDTYCGQRASAGEASGNASYCTARTPVAFDLSLTYGVSRKVELLLDIRLGLERDFGATDGADGPRLRHYAPGVRLWLTSGGAVDFFSTVQLAIDTTGYTDAAGVDHGNDVRLRNANGLQVDFHDAYGAYVYFAEQLAFRRWVEVGLEAGVGLQGRYP